MSSYHNSLHVDNRKINHIKGYSGTARTHNRKQRKKLEAMIRRYGQVLPILVDRDLVIVDGHAVHAAMIAAGFDEIAVIVVADRSPEEIRALRLALNRITEEATWDPDGLRTELQFLTEIGFNLDLTAFDAPEIDMALSIDEPSADAVEEVSQADLEPAASPAVQPGDWFTLGRHVVACGDARDALFLENMAVSRKAAAVFTDPPYNVPVDGFVSGLGKIRHREFPMAFGEMSPEEFTSFLQSFLGAASGILTPGAILFVCMDWRHIRELLDAASSQYELKNLCVWAKSNAGMGSFYRSQHELIAVLKFGDVAHRNNIELGKHGRNRSNLWRYAGVNVFGRDRMQLLGAHPTVKPTAMITDALKDVTRRGDLVLDPFLGSGSTLMAAEETGRDCVGIEMDPGYVETAIRRWETRTGHDALHGKTGETFAAYVERIRAGRSGAPVSEVEA
jgi:DNA modification methylase